MYLQSLIFSFVFAVNPHSPPLVPDNDLVHEDIDDISPLSSIPAPDAAPLPLNYIMREREREKLHGLWQPRVSWLRLRLIGLG